jgi:hypothetical protein
MRKIERRAKELGIHDVHRSEGRSHELLRCRGIRVAIPRHNEINTFTAESIMKSLEPVLGKDWWRNA